MRYLSLLLLFSLIGCFSSYNSNRPFVSRSGSMPPMEAGKCFAKSQMPASVETYKREIIEFTGTDLDNPFVTKVKDVLVPAGKKWEKRITDNCLSSNPKDCMVWCLVEEKEVAFEYYTVTDTAEVKEFDVYIKEHEHSVSGKNEWIEVLCENEINENIISQINTFLEASGYPIDERQYDKLNIVSKESLIKYQKENGLPIGNLDIQTLESMGIEK